MLLTLILSTNDIVYLVQSVWNLPAFDTVSMFYLDEKKQRIYLTFGNIVRIFGGFAEVLVEQADSWFFEKEEEELRHTPQLRMSQEQTTFFATTD